MKLESNFSSKPFLKQKLEQIANLINYKLTVNYTHIETGHVYLS